MHDSTICIILPSLSLGAPPTSPCWQYLPYSVLHLHHLSPLVNPVCPLHPLSRSGPQRSWRWCLPLLLMCLQELPWPNHRPQSCTANTHRHVAFNTVPSSRLIARHGPVYNVTIRVFKANSDNRTHPPTHPTRTSELTDREQKGAPKEQSISCSSLDYSS